MPWRPARKSKPGSTRLPETKFSSLWRELLPSGVTTYETRDFIHSPLLHPQERLAVHNAVPQRVEEFAAGRACAHRALASRGCAPAPLPRGADRHPVWPRGIVGSITHTEGYCAAAVAQCREIASIGIDAEIIGRIGDDLLPLICTPTERAWLAAMDCAQRAEAATILFSAKEAVFKCQSNAGGALPDFQDITLHFSAGKFFAAPCRGFAPAQRGTLQGRYKVSAGMVFTGIIFPAG